MSSVGERREGSDWETPHARNRKGEQFQTLTIQSFTLPSFYIITLSHPRSARTPPSATSGRGLWCTPSRFPPFAYANVCARRGILTREGCVAVPLVGCRRTKCCRSLGGCGSAPHGPALRPFARRGLRCPPRRCRALSFQCSRLPLWAIIHKVGCIPPKG
jgi:hypothetical protein